MNQVYTMNMTNIDNVNQIYELVAQAFKDVPHHAITDIVNMLMDGKTDADVAEYLYENGYTKLMSVEHEAYVSKIRLNEEDSAKLILLTKGLVAQLQRPLKLQNEQLSIQSQVIKEQTETIKFQANKIKTLEKKQQALNNILKSQLLSEYNKNKQELENLESKLFKSKATKNRISFLESENREIRKRAKQLKKLDGKDEKNGATKRTKRIESRDTSS